MPGILQTPDEKVFSRKLISAFLAEFLGSAVFALFGSSTTLAGTTNSSLNNSVGNGLTLTVVVFITANISGAQLNPSVTIAAFVAGYISLVKGIAYILCQVAGGILGSLLLAGLTFPLTNVGSDATPSGCFANAGINYGQLFGWESIMTFVLVMTVFAVAISEPDFGNVAPVAIGLALLVSVEAAGKFTGGALNPARALGPSVVFGCNWGTTWVYVLAEIAGGIVAGLLNLPLYGRGQHFLKAASDVVPPSSPSKSSGEPNKPADPMPLPTHVNITHSNLDSPRATDEKLLNTNDRIHRSHAPDSEIV